MNEIMIGIDPSKLKAIQITIRALKTHTKKFEKKIKFINKLKCILYEVVRRNKQRKYFNYRKWNC